jgi:putative glycosyltransferase (TIGR04372 family)
MELKLRNTPYNFLYKRGKWRIKSAYNELNNILFGDEKGQNIKHIKNIIMRLLPIAHHLRKPYFPAYLLCLIVSFPVVLLVRVVRPIVHIRFGRIHSGFGQTVLIPEVYLSRRKVGFDEQNTVDIFFFEGDIKNQQLRKMICRKMFVNPLIQPFYNANLFLSGWKTHLVKSPSYYPEPDVEHSFLEVPPQLTFQNEELGQVKTELVKYGMKPGDKFVCLYVRDAGYKLNSSSFGICFDVNQFGRIIDKLIDVGYYVLRMGKNVEKPLTYSHTRVIDYGWKFQSDLMDIWLAANCEFFVNTGGGLTSVAVAFRRPLINFNFDVFTFWSTAKDSLVAFNRFKKDGKYLTLREIIAFGFNGILQLAMNTKQTGIQIEEQSEQEVIDMIDEMISRLNGSWKTSNDLMEMQDRFRSILKEWDDFHFWHGKKLLCKVGHNYMLQNQDWLLK